MEEIRVYKHLAPPERKNNDTPRLSTEGASSSLATSLASDLRLILVIRRICNMDYNGKKYSARNTFIIDPTGKIAKVFVGVKPSGHSEEVLAALAELKKTPSN